MPQDAFSRYSNELSNMLANRNPDVDIVTTHVAAPRTLKRRSCSVPGMPASGPANMCIPKMYRAQKIGPAVAYHLTLCDPQVCVVQMKPFHHPGQHAGSEFQARCHRRRAAGREIAREGSDQCVL